MATVEDNILHSLKKNGFPDKRVSLPFQAIFKACKKENITLSDILTQLEKKDILNSVEGDKIIFFTKETEKKPEEAKPWEGIDFNNEMVKEAMEKLGEMDPSELEKIKQQVNGMTDAEKNEMFKRAKEMFNKTKK